MSLLKYDILTCGKVGPHLIVVLKSANHHAFQEWLLEDVDVLEDDSFEFHAVFHKFHGVSAKI